MEIAEFYLTEAGGNGKAWNGAEAVQKFAESGSRKFLTILMDVMMPVSGRIRGNQKNPRAGASGCRDGHDSRHDSPVFCKNARSTSVSMAGMNRHMSCKAGGEVAELLRIPAENGTKSGIKGKEGELDMERRKRLPESDLKQSGNLLRYQIRKSGYSVRDIQNWSGAILPPAGLLGGFRGKRFLLWTNSARAEPPLGVRMEDLLADLYGKSGFTGKLLERRGICFPIWKQLRIGPFVQ
ncbi:MAG: hypothetical protein ACLUD2_18785 [Clostridium sp.]